MASPIDQPLLARFTPLASTDWRSSQRVREGTEVARCTVERLTRKSDLRGIMRGKVVHTTVADTTTPCHVDRSA